MTAAEILRSKVSNNTAEDSFSLLPILLGEDTAPVRPYLLQQGFTGSRDLAIRRGNWKYLAHKGSGGNNYMTNLELKPYALPDDSPTAAGQLYYLANDPGETTNLARVHSEIVAELETLLKLSLASGRSRL